MEIARARALFIHLPSPLELACALALHALFSLFLLISDRLHCSLVFGFE